MRGTGAHTGVSRLARAILLSAGLCGTLPTAHVWAQGYSPAPPPPSLSPFGTSPPNDPPGSTPVGSAPVLSQETPVGPSAPIPQASVAPEGQTIDLSSALRLAGVQNLALVVAQQRVEYAVALQQFAAAQILPTLNLGGNYDSHTGTLQQDPGNMLTVNRSAMYVGAGANAVGSGTVQIPGLVYSLNLSEAIFGYLVTRQDTRQAQFDRRAVDNNVLRVVSLAYTDLLRASGLRALAVLARNDTGEIARLTADYAKTGEGRPADANRAATEFARRDQELQEALAAEAQASHALVELLNLDPLLRLVPLQSQVVPQPVVPTQMPLSELLAVAASTAPNCRLAARRFAVPSSSWTEPASCRFRRPCSWASAAARSAAAATSAPARGSRDSATSATGPISTSRSYWSLRNLGVGNKALIDAAHARLHTSELQELDVLDTVRDEVVTAYVQALAWLAQVKWHAQAVRSGEQAAKEDLIRVRGRQGLPIELLDSVRQVIEARRDYLNAIIDYNRAEVRLYVAIGNPPADMLARPVPDPLLHPPDQTLTRRRGSTRARGRFAGSRHGRSGVAKGVCELCHGGMVRALACAARHQQTVGPQLPPAPMSPAAGPVVTAPLNAGPGDPPSFADSLPSEGSGPLSSADAEASLKQFLGANVAPVDLMTAFRLVGEQNPQVLIAQSRVIEALALRQLAAVQFLPTLNAGTSLNSHRGTLQQSTGSILQVNRDSLYLGAGAFAVGGGSVNIPGVVLTGNVAVMTYDYLVARQEVERRRFVEGTVTQDTLLDAATGYLELLRAEELQKVAEQTRDDAREVARLTANYAQTGEGRKADADRAATELYRREALVIQASSDIGTASAQLAACCISTLCRVCIRSTSMCCPSRSSRNRSRCRS